MKIENKLTVYRDLFKLPIHLFTKKYTSGNHKIKYRNFKTLLQHKNRNIHMTKTVTIVIIFAY